jgi:hypothetical protein
MRFPGLVLTASFIATVQLVGGNVILTATEYATITVGIPFNLSWAQATGPVSLNLKSGPENSLSHFTTLGSRFSSLLCIAL